jgi:methylene-fatty-acyl-phospholipid synthase
MRTIFSHPLPSIHHPSIHPSIRSLEATYQQKTSSYRSAILEQPRARLLPTPLDTLVPAALFVIGQTFVVTSTWSLGITGTFLGDYFGILMDARVEGFPFNVLRDPMYVGSTMCFAATALWCVQPSVPIFAQLETVLIILLQVRASTWFIDHLVRVHFVYDRFEV